MKICNGYFTHLKNSKRASWWLSSKESACNAGDTGLIPGLGKIPWRMKWQPTLVFLSGKSHCQRSLEGYSPWGHKRPQHDFETKQQQKHLPCAKHCVRCWESKSELDMAPSSREVTLQEISPDNKHNRTRRREGDVVRGKEGDKMITSILEKLGRWPGGRGIELGP